MNHKYKENDCVLVEKNNYHDNKFTGTIIKLIESPLNVYWVKSHLDSINYYCFEEELILINKIKIFV